MVIVDNVFLNKWVNEFDEECYYDCPVTLYEDKLMNLARLFSEFIMFIFDSNVSDIILSCLLSACYKKLDLLKKIPGTFCCLQCLYENSDTVVKNADHHLLQ